MPSAAAAADISAKPIEIGPPHMWPEEAAVFERLLRTAPARYLEFGLGGSTLAAIRHGIAAIVAVESDPAWAEAVRRHPEIAPAIAAGRVSVLHADIGPVAQFGAPASLASLQRWPRYLQAPWAEWQRRGGFPDLVLVDGRFRVACCLSVLLAHALLGRADAGPLLVLHDVQHDRPTYAQVLEFFDLVESVRTLQVLRIRRTAAPLAAFVKLLEAQFDGQ